MVGHTSSGVSMPTSRYTNSLAEEFPSYNRTYKVESGVSNKYTRDYLPINTHVNNGNLTDTYIEFVLPSNGQEFMDLDSFAIEMKVNIVKANGNALDDKDQLTLVDGFAHRILNRSSLFLNGTSISSDQYFGVNNVVKSYLNMDSSILPTHGRNMYYKNLETDIEEIITAEGFTKNLNNRYEGEIIDDVKKGIHSVVPLNLDLASSNFYLLNGVEIRLRIDLAPPEVVINTHLGEKYKYNVEYMKLWVKKIVPYPSALLALNKSLFVQNRTVEYLFNKCVTKTYIWPRGYSNFSYDDIFTGLIPQYFHIYFVNQQSINGRYNRNSMYLSHCNLNQIRVDVNGNLVQSLSCNFPSAIAQLLHQTLANISPNSLLTHQSYRKGRTILSYDLRTSDCNDVIHLERTGNLKLDIQSETAQQENIIIFIVGVFTGVVEIDANRQVKTSFTL